MRRTQINFHLPINVNGRGNLKRNKIETNKHVWALVFLWIGGNFILVSLTIHFVKWCDYAVCTKCCEMKIDVRLHWPWQSYTLPSLHCTIFKMEIRWIIRLVQSFVRPIFFGPNDRHICITISYQCVTYKCTHYWKCVCVCLCVALWQAIFILWFPRPSTGILIRERRNNLLHFFFFLFH